MHRYWCVLVYPLSAISIANWLQNDHSSAHTIFDRMIFWGTNPLNAQGYSVGDKSPFKGCLYTGFVISYQDKSYLTQ